MLKRALSIWWARAAAAPTSSRCGGLRLLQSCDAVVYDDLIDPALLAQAAHAEQHPAGKRCGRHSMPQSEINSLLVRLGQSGKTVVRLKGGDPLVFGRGGEEFLALQAAGSPL